MGCHLFFRVCKLMTERLVVFLGYYDRYNLGDEAFKDAFKTIVNVVPSMSTCRTLFLNTDDVNLLPSDTSLLICGGGDIFNSYFLNRIHDIVNNSAYEGTIIAMSIGVPDPSMIRLGKVDIFDKVICRFKDDVKPIGDRIGNENVVWLPDVTCHLFDGIPIIYSEPKPTIDVGLFLARPICANIHGYRAMVKGIANGIDMIHLYLESLGYQSSFHLLPFNEDPNNDCEDDRILNKHVSTQCSKAKCHEYHSISSFAKMLQHVEMMDICICMRFHAHIFSFMSCKPVLSLNMSSKVTKLCDSMDYQYVYTLPKAKEGYPESFSGSTMAEVFERLWANRKTVFQYLCQQRQSTLAKTNHYRTLFLMMSDPQTLIRKNHPSRRKVDVNLVGVVRNMLSFMLDRLNVIDVDIDSEARQIVNGQTSFFAVAKLKETEQSSSITDIASGMARIMCFASTKTSFPIYHWGLTEQILKPDYNFSSSWYWMVEDWTKQETNIMNEWGKRVREVKCILELDQESNLPNVDLFHVEQLDYGGVHRSGWQYVVNHLLPLHGDNGIILDTYMDKTFGWCASFYKSVGVLPFNRSWIGFIHHTFATDYSENNAHAMLYTELFRQSLPYCKAIVVLSEDLKTKVYSEMKSILGNNTHNVPKIHVLFHPTEFVETSKQFSMENFRRNEDKLLVQIGAWLRDPFGIYRIPLDEQFMNSIGIKKAALQGKSMENYFRPKRVNLVLTSDNNEPKTMISRCACQCTCRTPPIDIDDLCPCDKQAVPNKWVHGMLEFIEDVYSKVRVIPQLSDVDYDDLLSKNLVFLNLKDASAANTIIECIVRNTPILVNPLPAVVEYLGRGYPFYYSSFAEAAFKCTNIDMIRDAHFYLKKMDKSNLNIRTFLDQLVKILVSE